MEEKNISQEESLKLITTMITKGRATYNERGWSPIMWGSVVIVASVINFIGNELGLEIGYIWFLVVAAIVPQVYFTIKERRDRKVRSFEDDAINAAWLVYGITIFGLVAYQNIVPVVSVALNAGDGFELIKHYTNGTKADEKITPFILSGYSLYILVYAFPTMITGLAKKFKPMIVGGIVCYAMFIVSCYTPFKYDLLAGAVAALFAWLIPGIILRKKYLAQQKQVNV